MSDRNAVVGAACGWCGEPMTDPVTVDEGTVMEDYACRGECAEHCTYEEVVDYPHGEDGGYWGVGAE